MSKTISAFAAAAAVLTLAPAATAQPQGGPDLARYDAASARTLGEQLVLCDLAGYFGTGPDLNAQQVILRRDNQRYENAFPLAITRGAVWYDEDLERTFHRHRAAGRISSREVDALKNQYGMEMERHFRRTTFSQQRFFQDQSRFCRDLVKASWR